MALAGFMYSGDLSLQCLAEVLLLIFSCYGSYVRKRNRTDFVLDKPSDKKAKNRKNS